MRGKEEKKYDGNVEAEERGGGRRMKNKRLKLKKKKG